MDENNYRRQNYPFYIKYLNLICFCVSILFFAFLVLTTISTTLEYRAFNNKIDEMLEYCNNLNSSISNNVSNNNNSSNDNIDITEQIYYDGKTALIEAYNKAIEKANSLEIIGTGKISLEAPAKLSANIQIDIAVQRYSKTKVYEESFTKIIDTNVSFNLLGKANSAVKRLKDGSDNAKVLLSRNVKFEGTKIIGDFENLSAQNNVNEKFFNDNFYIINEETIEEITFFKIKKSNDKIKNYCIQAKLNSILATEKYKNIIAQQLGTNNITFNSIIITAILDAKGNIISFSGLDYFNFNFSGLYCKARCSITYKVSNVNIENNFEYSDL